MENTHRPVGVLVLAIVGFGAFPLFLLLALAAFAVILLTGPILDAGSLAGIAVPLATFGVLALVSGLGFLLGARWARALGFGWAGVWGALAVLCAVSGVIVSTVLFAACAAGLAWYLTRPGVAAWFTR